MGRRSDLELISRRSGRTVPASGLIRVTISRKAYPVQAENGYLCYNRPVLTPNPQPRFSAPLRVSQPRVKEIACK